MGRANELGQLFKWFIFSDLGLLCLVVLYCIGGAYLFQAIEYDKFDEYNRNVSKASFDVENSRSAIAEQIYMYKGESQSDFSDTVDALLEMYQTKIVGDAIVKYRYNGHPVNFSDLVNGWRYPNALLFTISVVTTIGYGQVTPYLSLGQMVLVIYAVIGVPMNLMFLSSTGKVMARWFRHAYNHGCCYICWKQRKATFNAKRRRLIWSLKHGKLKRSDLENHSAAKLEAKMKADNSVHFGEVTDAEANKILREDVDVWCQFVEIMEHVDEDKNVPISLVLIVIAVYLFLGCVLFSAFNGWSYAKAAYFCFVSLATIGFGDIITNTDKSGPTGDLQTIVIYAYIYFGLSVISMSFNLMIVEMKSKVSNVLTALGLKEKEPVEPSPDEDEEVFIEEESMKRPKSAMLQVPEKFHSSY